MLEQIIPAVAILAASAMLGNWYLREYKKARKAGLPWYRAYFSVPGIVITIIILLFPFIARYLF